MYNFAVLIWYKEWEVKKGKPGRQYFTITIISWAIRKTSFERVNLWKPTEILLVPYLKRHVNFWSESNFLSLGNTCLPGEVTKCRLFQLCRVIRSFHFKTFSDKFSLYSEIILTNKRSRKLANLDVTDL